MHTLLLVEDDKAILDMLDMFLSSKNYQIIRAINGQQALMHLNETTPDLALLDWMLPDTDGLQLIQKIRNMPLHRDLPILMLTAKAEEANKIEGLDVGADDYMTKPVSLQELDARVRALIRRSQGLNPQQLLQRGSITIAHENKEVTINDEPVKISGTEYRLLYYLMKNPNRIFTRAQLLDHVWGQTVYVDERTVDVHIMRLRKILKRHNTDKMLKTIRGTGYRFDVNGI